MSTKPGAGSTEREAGKTARLFLVLGIHVGVRACVCRTLGVIGRGPLTHDTLGQFAAGAASFRASQVVELTIEPDLITIHLEAEA